MIQDLNEQIIGKRVALVGFSHILGARVLVLPVHQVTKQARSVQRGNGVAQVAKLAQRPNAHLADKVNRANTVSTTKLHLHQDIGHDTFAVQHANVGFHDV